MMTIVGVAMLVALVPGAAVLGLALTAAEERGWIRQSKTSGSTAFAVVEDLLSPSASQARQVLQEQKRIGQRAPAPGDGLGDGPSVTGRFAGKLTVSVNRSQKLASQTSATSSPIVTESPVIRPRSI
jgi:hypothetical protein